MKRIFAAVLSVALLISAFYVSAAAETPQVTYRIGNASATEPIEVGGQITLFEPSADLLGERVFIGWVLTEGGARSLWPAGTVYTHTGSGDLVFEALSVNLRTMSGAAVSIGDQTTLRFDGAVNTADHALLVSLLGAENVTLGVLVARYSEIYGGSRRFTFDCGAESLINCPSQGFSYSTQEDSMFVGRTAAIPNDRLLEKYAGRAYLSLNMNGTTVTYYAAFDPYTHARTAHGVSAAAYDSQSKPCEVQYTEAQMQFLRARLDRVVSVKMATSTDPARVVSEYSLTNFANDFVAFAAYTSPYTLLEVRGDSPAGYDTYVVVGKDGGDFHNIGSYFIGGSARLPKGTECQSDGYCISVLNHTQ